jgi:hypothetical protein
MMIQTYQAELLYELFQNQGFEPGSVLRKEHLFAQQPLGSLWAFGAGKALPGMIGRGLIRKIWVYDHDGIVDEILLAVYKTGNYPLTGHLDTFVYNAITRAVGDEKDRSVAFARAKEEITQSIAVLARILGGLADAE